MFDTDKLRQPKLKLIFLSIFKKNMT